MGERKEYKCVAKRLTWFGETCGEPVIMTENGRLKHKFADRKTYDHEPEIERRK